MANEGKIPAMVATDPANTVAFVMDHFGSMA